MARPTKYTPETVEKILHALRLGATHELAGNAAGVSVSTFCEWLQRKPEFYEAVKVAEGEAASKWLSIIDQAAADGNWQAAAWKLERRYPQMYGRVSPQAAIAAQVEVSGGKSANGPAISVQFFAFNTVAAALTDGSAEDR